MKTYIFSVSIEDIEANNEDEAMDKAEKLISDGDYDMSIVDIEEVEEL